MKWLMYPLLILLAIGAVYADTSAFQEADPRLEKKVTIEVNHSNLEEVVESLVEQSGVDIKAGTGIRDWKVRERKIIVHAKDMPLGRMLDEIRRVTGFHLSREGQEGEWSYVIWQDLKGRRYEEEMLISAQEAQAQRAVDIRQGALDAAAQALKMTPEEALKNREKDPLAAYLGGTKTGRAFSQILTSLQSRFPNEYGLMMRGKKITIPAASLPPNLEGAVTDIMSGGLISAIAKMAPPDTKLDLVPHQLIIEGLQGADEAVQGLLGFGGIVTFQARLAGQEAPHPFLPLSGGEIPAGFLPMASPDSKIGGMFGKFLFAVEDGADLAEAGKQIQAEATSAEGIANLVARKSATEDEPPTDPELLREIEVSEVFGAIAPGMQLAGLPEEHGKMIAEIARAAEISVLVESYTGMVPVSAFIKKGKQPFYNVLIAAEKAGCTWDLEERTLRIRPEDWAIQRSKEIPESFLNHYKALLEKNGCFSLDDLAAIAIGLTDSQIEGGLKEDKELGHILSAVIDNKGRRDVLRAYGLMNPHQKERLVEKDGLRFAQLTDEQWAYFEEIITDRLGGVHIIDGYIHIVPREEEGQRPNTEIFELMVFTANEEEPRSVKTWVNVPTKEHIKQVQEQRKKMQEEIEKARKEHEEAQKQQ